MSDEPRGRPVTPADVARLEVPAGLCETCRHAGILASRSSVFLRCGMAEIDPSFPRYPRLPVLACKGYERVEDGGTPA